MIKLGNRRKRRPDYLLDVKVQKQGQLRRRARVGGALLAGAMALGLAGFGVFRLGRWAAAKLVFENKRFVIAQIVVQNDGVLDPPRVMQFAGVQLGQNLLSLDLKQVQRNLEMIPLVRQAEVRRVFPGQLVLKVDERVPVARLQGPTRELSETVFLIDRTGVVMKPLRLSDGTVVQPQMTARVPTLSGLSVADFRVGRKVESPQIYRALELLDQLEQSRAGSLLQAERVDLSKPRQLILRTRQGTIVQFDTEQFPQQLRRLNVILSWAQQRQRTVQTVDLTVARAVPVTFVN